MAVFSTVISIVVAVFFAYLTERTDLPFRNLAWGLMLIPMAMPGLLFAVSWTFLLSPQIGIFNVWLREIFSWFGVILSSGPFNIYGGMAYMIFLEGLRGVTTAFLIIVGGVPERKLKNTNVASGTRIKASVKMTIMLGGTYCKRPRK